MEQVLLAEQARSQTPPGGQVAATATDPAASGDEISTSKEAVPNTSTSSAGQAQNTPSLEAEIDQVVQSLGKVGTGLSSFWGGLRAQSSSAYSASIKQLGDRAEAARKDLAPYMDQAKPYMDSAKAEYLKTREELAKLGEELNKPVDPPQDALKGDADRSANDTPTPSFYGEVMTPGDSSSSNVGPSPPTVNLDFNPSAFFGKISNQISNNPNLASLQSNLNKNLSKIAPMASSGSKMAEAYLHKGEEYIKHAGADLERYLGQAVRIVPAEGAPASPALDGHEPSHKGKSSSTAQMLQLAGRKEQLLHRLATNQTIFLLDPAQPLETSSGSSAPGQTHEDTKETFHAFLHDVDTHGGFDGAFWKERIQNTLQDPKNAPLKTTMDSIVPEKISAHTFWARYFFRVSQIEADDARRKQILETAADHQDQSEDDFSWDNEDEADTPAPTKEAKTEAAPHTGDLRRPSSESERGLSTSSYDVVSQPSASGPPSDTEAIKKVQVASSVQHDQKPQQTPQQQEEEDEDSDWE